MVETRDSQGQAGVWDRGTCFTCLRSSSHVDQRRTRCGAPFKQQVIYQCLGKVLRTYICVKEPPFLASSFTYCLQLSILLPTFSVRQLVRNAPLKLFSHYLVQQSDLIITLHHVEIPSHISGSRQRRLCCDGSAYTAIRSRQG